MKILVIRFSAMGDVAMTLPAIHAFLTQNKNAEIYFVSKKMFEPIFFNIPRFHFIGYDSKIHKGIFGLLKFTKLISNITNFDAVIDLHLSLRSRFISYFFYLKKVSFYTIDKGRIEKKALTSESNKKLFPLKHQTERYADVFNSYLSKNKINLSNNIPLILTKNNLLLGDSIKIGIAPLAAHALKEWGVENYKNLILGILKEYKNVSIYIFGSNSDIDILSTFIISDKIKLAVNLPNKLYDELDLISKLDLMISNDSGNMHLAAMLGTKVLGIFGPTHSFLGFAPYLQSNNVIELENITCRPCSVYGNTTCFRGDHACMTSITSDLVLYKIKNILK